MIESLKEKKANVNGNVLKEVAEYKLVDIIGQGAYGTIYLSQSLNNGETYAIKEVNYSSASELQGTMDEVEILSIVSNFFDKKSWNIQIL